MTQLVNLGGTQKFGVCSKDNCAAMWMGSVCLRGACLATSKSPLCLCSNVTWFRSCRLGSSESFLQGHPPCKDTTLPGHPTAGTHRMGWQPEPLLSSGCLQEKFGGTVTQFLLLCVLKAKERFGDWTSMQQRAPVQRLYLSRMTIFHSSVTNSLLAVVGCNSFFSPGGRTGHTSAWVANNFP